MKNHPDITENVDWDVKNQIKQTNQYFHPKNFRMCQACICVQAEVFDKLLLYFHGTKVVGLMCKVYVYFSPTCA